MPHAEMRGQGQGDQHPGGSEQGHHHARAALRRRHRQLGPAGHRRPAGRRLAGANNACLPSLQLASNEEYPVRSASKDESVLPTSCTTVTSHVTATLAVWAGAEPAGVCEHAVAPAAHQLAHRARGQAGQAAPAAQHAVGHHLPRRDARGAGMRPGAFSPARPREMPCRTDLLPAGIGLQHGSWGSAQPSLTVHVSTCALFSRLIPSRRCC